MHETPDIEIAADEWEEQQAVLKEIDRSRCGLCGSDNLNDLGAAKWKFQTQGAVVCNDCNAHWWNKWMTKTEWEAWVNGGELNSCDALRIIDGEKA